MKTLISLLFAGLLLLASCAPRYATCPTYAQTEKEDVQSKKEAHFQNDENEQTSLAK